MTIAPFNSLAMDVPLSKAEKDLAIQQNTNSAGNLRNEFLTLMVAQIQNQDPLNPMEGAEYVSQLAQFSQVESSENMASMMQNSAVTMNNIQMLTTAGLVGQTVYVGTDRVNLSDQTQQGKIVLSAPSDTVNLVLTDAYGQATTIPLGPQASGDVNFTLDPDKLDLEPGCYSVNTQLQNGVAGTIFMAGSVAQVSVPSNGGAAFVNVSGIGMVPFYDISQFGALSK